MFASLIAGLSTKLLIAVGGIFAVFAAFFTGKFNGANAEKKAQQSSLIKSQMADLHEEQAVNKDMTNAQINGPRNLKELSDKARNGQL